MQAAKLADHFGPRPQEKVIRIAENYSRIELILEPLESDALDRALRADRHKNRRFDHGTPCR